MNKPLRLKLLIVTFICPCVSGSLGCTATQVREEPLKTVNYSENYYVPTLSDSDKQKPEWSFQPIVVSVEQAPLISVLSMIRDENDNNLFINLGNINPDYLVTISHKGTKEALLKRIQDITGYTVKTKGNTLIWSDVITRVFDFTKVGQHIAVQQSVVFSPYTSPVLLAPSIKVIESMLGPKGSHLFNKETATVTVIDKRENIAAISDYLAQEMARVIKNTHSADKTALIKATEKISPLKFPEKLPVHYDFFNLLDTDKLTERIIVDHQTGTIRFHMHKGKLEENLLALVNNTKGRKDTSLIWNGGDQGVYSNHWATGRSMFELMNNILKPYIAPEQLLLGIYEGGTISVYYQNNRRKM